MKTHDIVVIGASSGGVEALTRLLAALPADLPAAVFAVLHIPVQPDDLLPSVLRPRSKLPVESAVDGHAVTKGHVYVAPPDHHLTLSAGRMHLARGPKENRHRPALDPLFRSAAKAYGPRVVGVILSGNLDDGMIGLNSIKVHGGIALVQSPEEAGVPEMVLHALTNVQVDARLPVTEIARRLGELAATPVKPERKISGQEDAVPGGLDEIISELGSPTPYICPQCHGPLWERKVGKEHEFRCHVGHVYSSESLLIDQNDDLERALWTAVRLFSEQANLLRRLARRDVHGALLSKWNKRIRQNVENAAAIRALLQARRPPNLREAAEDAERKARSPVQAATPSPPR